MVPVIYSIEEHILTNITNIMSIFSQFFTFWVLLSILFVPNPDWVRVPVVQKKIVDVMLPFRRIKSYHILIIKTIVILHLTNVFSVINGTWGSASGTNYHCRHLRRIRLIRTF